MEIIFHKTSNTKINLIELVDNVTGINALGLNDYLYTCLDKGKLYHIINLKRVKTIDSIGINVLSDFINKGLNIGLFNVNAEIRQRLESFEGVKQVKIYDEIDSDKVVNMFENDTQELKIKDPGFASGRKYPRINTNLELKFNCLSFHDEVISGKAKVLNLSEGGLFAGSIVAVNKRNGTILCQPEILKQEFYDMHFKLSEDAEFNDIKGECVRVVYTDKKLSAGVHFKSMNEDIKTIIRNYTCSNGICNPISK